MQQQFYDAIIILPVIYIQAAQMKNLLQKKAAKYFDIRIMVTSLEVKRDIAVLQIREYYNSPRNLQIPNY